MVAPLPRPIRRGERACSIEAQPLDKQLTHLGQRIALNLPHTLARQPELLADLVEAGSGR